MWVLEDVHKGVYVLNKTDNIQQNIYIHFPLLASSFVQQLQSFGFLLPEDS